MFKSNQVSDGRTKTPRAWSSQALTSHSSWKLKGQDLENTTHMLAYQLLYRD